MTVVAYSPALSGGFIWDDDFYITRNPLLTAPDGLRRIWFSLESPSQYFPLVYTTFRIERGLWGLNPAGYHWVNLLLHVANALVLWRLLVRLKVPGGWLAAAIFALHPVQVESVAWITERKNVLMGFFFLLTLHAWLTFVEARTGRRRLIYVLALILYALALSAKTTACTLPVALLLILWLEKRHIDYRRILQIVPFVVLGVGMGLVAVWWERYHQGTRGALFALGPIERVLIASRGIWFYLSKLVWPSNISFFYPKWHISQADPFAYVWLIATVLLGIAIYCGRRFTGRGVEVATLFFVSTLGPVLGFIMLYTFRYTFVADHYQYLASIGVFALIAAGITRLAEAVKYTRRLVWVGACGVPLLLGVLSWRQSATYRDPETLWHTTIARNSKCEPCYNNLGLLLVRKGQVDQAIGFYDKASEINPGDPEPQSNLGYAFLVKGQVDEAINRCQKALEIDPQLAQAHHILGDAYLSKNDFDQAIASYQRALRIQPDDVTAHDNLGISLSAVGRTKEALQQFREAVEIDPNSAEAHYNLGYLLVRMGQQEEAAVHFAVAVRIKPDYVQAKEQLRALGVSLPGH